MDLQNAVVLTMLVVLAALFIDWCRRALREGFVRETQIQRDMDLYLATHPPISDEEYVKLFSPDVPPEVAIKVRTILEDALGVDREIIYPDARLVTDLGAY